VGEAAVEREGDGKGQGMGRGREGGLEEGERKWEGL